MRDGLEGADEVQAVNEGSLTSQRTGWRAWLGPSVALLLFLGLSAWCFAPIWSQLESAFIGKPDSDVLRNAWGFWWFKAMLLERLRIPSFTIYMNYPRGMLLLVIDPLNCLLSLPLQAFLKLPAAYNVYLMSTVAFSGLTAFLLARRLTGKDGPALVAGALYAFAPYVLSSAIAGNSEVVNVGWIPLFFLALLEALEHGGAQKGRWLGAALICTTLASWYYGYVAAFFGALWALLELLSRAVRKRPLRPQLIALAHSSLLFLIFSAVMLVIFRDILPSVDKGLSQGGRDQLTVLAGNAVNLWDMFQPTPERWDRPSLYHFPVPFLLAFPALLLLGIKRAWPWALLGTLALLLAMSLRVQSHPMELRSDLWGVWQGLSRLSQSIYRSFLWIPFSSAIRFPGRFLALFNLALAMITACGLSALFVRHKRLELVYLVFGACLAVAVAGELRASARFSTLFATTPVVVPSYVEIIRQDPDFVAVAHLPTDLQGRYQLYYQTVHGKPLLNYVDFVTSRLYFLEDRKLPISYSDTLYGMQQRGYDDYMKRYPEDVPAWPTQEQNREQLERLRQAGLRYIVVDRQRFKPESLLEFEALIEPHADRIERTDDHDLYRLNAP